MKKDKRVYISPISKDDTNLKNGMPYFVKAIAYTASGSSYPEGGRAFFRVDSCDGNYVIYGTNHLDGRRVPDTRVYRCLSIETTPLPNVRRILRNVVRRAVKAYLNSRDIPEKCLDDNSSRFSRSIADMFI